MIQLRVKYRASPGAEHGLTSESNHYLHIDNTGNIWLGNRGTNEFGAFRLDRKSERFIHYRHNKNDKLSLSDNEIQFITEDDLGRIWIGTDEGGINIYENGGFKNVIDTIGLVSTPGHGRARNGKMWITTYGGGGVALVAPDKNVIMERIRD